MALTNMQLDASVGLPQPVVLQPKRRMTNSQFYRQQPSVQPAQEQQQQPQQPTSEDFIREQFGRLSQKAAVPELNPGARVTAPNTELVQPSNFQTYYDRMASIQRTNQALLGQIQARAAYQRAQQFQNSLQNSWAAQGTGGGGGSAPVGRAGSAVVPSSPKANFQYAQNIAGNYGWNNQAELAAWYQLGMNESGWNNNAQNKSSTAYGIGQFLDSTWGGYGIPKTSDPALQVEAMARYIRARYGSPSRALAAWNSRSPHWY